jgi:hypothetical protein
VIVMRLKEDSHCGLAIQGPFVNFASISNSIYFRLLIINTADIF